MKTAQGQTVERQGDGLAGAPAAAWADAGYFRGRSRIMNALRLLWQLVQPPRGHKIRPTRAGLLLIGLAMGVGTAAFNTANNILYLGLAFLLSSLLLSGVLSWVNLKGCEWRISGLRWYRVGEAGAYWIHVRNRKTRLPSYGLRFQVALAGVAAGEVPLRGALEAGGVERVLEGTLVPARRGRVRIDLEGVSSKYPFGFLSKRIRYSTAIERIVWPPRCRVQWHGAVGGAVHLRGWHLYQKGEGTELQNLRPYRVGDAVKAVHWKASARMKSLMVKETEQERRAVYWVRMALAGVEETEAYIAAVASVLEQLAQRGELRGLRAPGIEIAYNGRSDGLERMLDWLAQLETDAPKPIAGGTGGGAQLQLRAQAGGGFEITCDGRRCGEVR